MIRRRSGLSLSTFNGAQKNGNSTKAVIPASPIRALEPPPFSHDYIESSKHGGRTAGRWWQAGSDLAGAPARQENPLAWHWWRARRSTPEAVMMITSVQAKIMEPLIEDGATLKHLQSRDPQSSCTPLVFNSVIPMESKTDLGAPGTILPGRRGRRTQRRRVGRQTQRH